MNVSLPVFLVIAALALELVFAAGTVGIGLLMGAQPKEVRLGMFAPRLFSIAGVPIHVGLPLGGASVQFRSEEEDDGSYLLDDLPFPRRLAIVWVPWLALFTVGPALLGVDRALDHLAAGLWQPFDVLSYAARWREFLTLASRDSAAAVGVLFTRVAAFNLLPLPTNSTGATLRMAFRGRAPVLAHIVMLAGALAGWAVFGWAAWCLGVALLGASR